MLQFAIPGFEPQDTRLRGRTVDQPTGHGMVTGRSRVVSQEREGLSATLAGIIEPLSGKDLEAATMDAIRKHRELMETAERAYELWNKAPNSDPEKGNLEHSYTQAMMNNSAQIAVVDALISKLGYIPSVPACD